MNVQTSEQDFGEAVEHVNALLFEMNNPFGALDDATRKQAAKEIGAKAQIDFEESLTRLKELMRSCNPLQVLAHIEYYDCTMLSQPSVKQEEKDNTYQPVQQFAIELFQALFLTTPTAELLVRITPPEVLIEINSVLHKLGDSYMMIGMGEHWDENDPSSHRRALNRHIRHHTFAVRNAGFQDQVMAQLKDLFSPLDSEFENRTGVKLSALVVMWENLSARYARKMNEDRRHIFEAFRSPTAQEIINAYSQWRELDSESFEWLSKRLKISGGSVKVARGICFDHYDKSLMEFYRHELNDFVECYPGNVDPNKLRLILIEWSIQIEGLVGIEIERLFVDNPIWKRPIIYHPEISWFYWPIPQLFHSFGLEMLENLLSSHPDLEVLYKSKYRSDYLEEEVSRKLEAANIGASIHQNVEWTDPKTNRVYETDVFFLLDNIAVIIECKSGKITSPARRGAPERVQKEVKKLIEDASEQSLRLAELLTNSKSIIRLRPKKRPVITVDPKSIRRVIRLNVTLDFFGPFACEVRAMREAGLLQAHITNAPTIAIVDFETILHLLPYPAQQLHYLARRAEIERHLGLEGDETDLLAFYMATGFNIGEVEFETNRRLNFANLGSQLEPYLFARSAGVAIKKPMPKLTIRWSQMLSAFNSRRFNGWLYASFILLSVAHKDQEEFERQERQMFFNIASSPPRDDELNVIASSHGPQTRRTGVLSIGVRSVSREQRSRMIENAVGDFIEREGVNEVVFLCHNVFDFSVPYWVAGLHLPKHP